MLVTWLIFTIVLGACIGSFLNVVIYRVPLGQSIISPPSTCPKCGCRLAWYDNIPILAWFYLCGKCRKCKQPVSFQYPLIEAITAAVFGLWFVICYLTPLRPDFSVPTLENTFPVFIIHLVLFAGLIAATVIDARHFIIPLSITWLIAAAALVILPANALLLPESIAHVPKPIYISQFSPALADTQFQPYANAASVQIAQQHNGPWPALVSALPVTNSRGITIAACTTIGLIISLLLLRLRILPRSFNEPFDDTNQSTTNTNQSTNNLDQHTNDPDHFFFHPHPRREALKECLFIALPIIGLFTALFISTPNTWSAPPWLQTIPGVMLGYIIGGGTVWLTRILGTLGFGKEAMGLGDVHLMAAVGAVCGWQVAIIAFFIAPFFGLTWALASAGIEKLLKREVKEIPYGPHLAIATLLTCILREPLITNFGILFLF